MSSSLMTLNSTYVDNSQMCTPSSDVAPKFEIHVINHLVDIQNKKEFLVV